MVGLGRLISETRWAWRGVRARGWRAGLIVALLSVALGAATVVFSAADSLVFDRIPYPNAGRLLVLQRVSTFSGPSDYVLPPVFREWRKHTDLFSAVHAHDRDISLYLTVGQVTEAIRTQRVSPGLFEMLGVRAQWGRLLQAGDEQPDRPAVAVIGEALARRVFGDPAAAVGQTLRAGTSEVVVVGVMPAVFRFPTSREQIWLPLDLARQRDNVGIRALLLRSPDVSMHTLAGAVRERAASIERVTRFGQKEPTAAVPLASASLDARLRLVVAMLFGAAVCLLLIACSNVASLELAAAFLRARTLAIHAALGASRTSLVRTALFEVVFLIGASVVLAWGFATWGMGVLTASLPPAMSDPLANPIDVDRRALAFLAAAASLTWLLASLPAVVRAARRDVLEVLMRDHRSGRTPIGIALRQLLTTAQVALTVVLLTGSVLVIRTYSAQIALEKGFDSRGLAAVTVLQPPNSGPPAVVLTETLLSRLRAQPGVIAVARAGSIPPSTAGGVGNKLSIVGRPTTAESIKLSTYTVDPQYFDTMGIRILAGRAFTAADPGGQLVVDEAFARKYWPAGDALGARFNMGGAGFAGAHEFQIVGIAAHVRGDRDVTVGGEDQYAVYGRIPSTSHPLSFVIRLEHPRQLGSLATLVREAAPGTIIRAELIDDRYARLFGDVRLAASVTAGFGVLAFVVAVSGIYGVMVFLVAIRTREIGVRLALGASPGRIRRMVLGSSAPFVAAGILLGIGASVAASTYLKSLLFGVSSFDPATLAAVGALLSVTALAAAYAPARRASQVDPAITLRAE